MSNPTNLAGDLIVPGDVRITGALSPLLAKSSVLAISELQVYPVPLTDFRVWDNMAALLPTAGATDDLGIIEGTFGVGTPSLQTEDLKAAGATNNRARVLVHLPAEYVAAQTVKFRFMAGMITTVADSTATVDCEAYKLQGDPDDVMGSDLVTSGATSINSTVFANADFTVTTATLSPGDVLDVRITTAVNDAATGTAVIAGITSLKLLCDIR